MRLESDFRGNSREKEESKLTCLIQDSHVPMPLVNPHLPD